MESIKSLLQHLGFSLEFTNATREIKKLGYPIESIHFSLHKYFMSYICVKSIDSIIRILNQHDLLEENTNYYPGYVVSKFGFIVIGTTPCGDALGVDTTDGKVYELSHETMIEDGFTEYGTNEFHPLSRELIFKTLTLKEWSDIDHFFTDCLDEIISMEEKEAEFLSKWEADPNAKDEEGEIRLFYFLALGTIDQIKHDIERGADLSSVNGDRSLLLSYAIGCDRYDAADLMIANGYKIDFQNQWGETALMQVASEGDTIGIEYLLKKGASVLPKDEFGQSVFDLLCKYQNYDENLKLLNDAK